MSCLRFTSSMALISLCRFCLLAGGRRFWLWRCMLPSFLLFSALLWILCSTASVGCRSMVILPACQRVQLKSQVLGTPNGRPPCCHLCPDAPAKHAFLKQLDLIQSGILVHQQHIIQGHLGHQDMVNCRASTFLHGQHTTWCPISSLHATLCCFLFSKASHVLKTKQKKRSLHMFASNCFRVCLVAR